jgi:glutamate racemase
MGELAEEVMNAPIGISDSGVGGLSVVSKMLTHLPEEEILYFGDTAHVPYGEKSPEEIRHLVFRILDFFSSRHAKAVIMACNTSSAIVLEEARQKYDMPIIGVIEPAIREALRVSRGKKIGLIANGVTASSGVHQKLMTKISGNGVRVLPQACPRLVPLVENGILSGTATDDALAEYLRPLQDHGIDTLILGCTHYPFLESSIRKLLDTPVNLVDPSELTVLSLKEILQEKNLQRISTKPCNHTFYVSGDPGQFREVGSMLLGTSIPRVNKTEV